MQVKTYIDRVTMSRAAARDAARILRQAIREKAAARIIAATGASQLDFLDALTGAAGIDWSRVEMFHLDEYVGLPIDHPASFRKYLRERLITKTGIVRHHLLDGERDAGRVADDIGREIAKAPVDVAFVGIGENGHLAFNDPPADFETERPYLIVTLDEACRRQQVGEGWFASVLDVPSQAIRSEEHTSELQSLAYLVCRLLLEKKKTHYVCVKNYYHTLSDLCLSFPQNSLSSHI